MSPLLRLLSLLPKLVLPCSVFGGLAIVLQPLPSTAREFDPRMLWEFGIFLAGIVGVAAVMRVDVGRLVKWQERHVEAHERVAKAITELKTLNEGLKEATERRLNRLEDQAFGRIHDDSSHKHRG